MVSRDFVESGENFSSAISELLAKDPPLEHQLIIYGGCIEGTICNEFWIPQMSYTDIASAIEYELSRLLPCQVDESITGFRVIEKNIENSKFRLRCGTTLYKYWNELISDLKNVGIKVDTIIHSFMVLDPVLSDLNDFYLPQIEPDFIFSYDANEKIRKITCAENEDEKHFAGEKTAKAILSLYRNENETTLSDYDDPYIPALLLAAYGLSEDFEQDRQYLQAIPKGMFPERFRGLRILFSVFIVISLLLLIGIWGRNVCENMEKLNDINNEIEKISKVSKQIKIDIIKNKKFDEMMEKVREVEPELGNHEIFLCLAEFTRKTPEDMWVTSFNFRKGEIDATFFGKSDSKDSNIDFSSSPLFGKQETNKSRPPDGSLKIFTKLDYLGPSKRAKPEKNKDKKEKEKKQK